MLLFITAGPRTFSVQSCAWGRGGGEEVHEEDRLVTCLFQSPHVVDRHHTKGLVPLQFIRQYLVYKINKPSSLPVLTRVSIYFSRASIALALLFSLLPSRVLCSPSPPHPSVTAPSLVTLKPKKLSADHPRPRVWEILQSAGHTNRLQASDSLEIIPHP
jgi:hypothetical protein